jgi:hypothetical protein
VENDEFGSGCTLRFLEAVVNARVRSRDSTVRLAAASSKDCSSKAFSTFLRNNRSRGVALIPVANSLA